MKKRPYILTIAGFDPTSGAGLTADIKTFEALQCYGLAVCTANTIQTDHEFKKCHWIPESIILEQLQLLLSRFDITTVKIGIIENWVVLLKVVQLLLQYNSDIKIVLDPVLKASTNFDFHNMPATLEKSMEWQENLELVLEKVYLVTPNIIELHELYKFHKLDYNSTIKHISTKTNLLVKGGHKTEYIGIDDLYTLNQEKHHLKPKKIIDPKHGSGCVLSAAIAAYTAHEFSIYKACKKAKKYTEQFLTSNETLLGYHKL